MTHVFAAQNTAYCELLRLAQAQTVAIQADDLDAFNNLLAERETVMYLVMTYADTVG